MEISRRLEIFESVSIPKAVMALCIPTVLANTVTILYNLADTYFVGMLGNPAENAAVTLAYPLLLAFNAVNNLFGVGCSSLMSRSLGLKDYDAVRKVSSFGFYASLFCAVLYALILTVFKPFFLGIIGATPDTIAATDAYLKWTVTYGAVPTILNVVMSYMVRSEGAAFHASIGTMSGCIINIMLDPFFVLPWGLGLGAEGAGLATFISNCCAVLYFLILIFVNKRKGTTFISISFRDFGFRKTIIFGIFAVGIPACIQNLLNVTGLTIFNNFASAYGADAVAGVGIAGKIHSVPMTMGMGIAGGIMPLVSYNWSSGNYERLKKCMTFSRRVMMSFLCTVSLMFLLFAEELIAVFMDLPRVVEVGSFFLRVLAFTLPLLSMDFIAVNFFQAIGMGKGSLMFALSRKLFLEIPLLFIFNHFWHLWGLPFAQLGAELILAITAVITLHVILKKKGV